MRRKIPSFAIVLIASVLLSACDKCGGLQEIRLPGAPKTCSDDPAH
jgi:hypothetical protein